MLVGYQYESHNRKELIVKINNKGELVLEYQNEQRTFNKEFVLRAIHQKLYGDEYRKKRNKTNAALIRAAKAAGLKV